MRDDQVRFNQEGTSHPVGVDPRIPVVDRVVARVPTHPPIVIALESWREQLLINLPLNARADQLGNRIEWLPQHVVNPRQ